MWQCYDRAGARAAGRPFADYLWLERQLPAGPPTDLRLTNHVLKEKPCAAVEE